MKTKLYHFKKIITFVVLGLSIVFLAFGNFTSDLSKFERVASDFSKKSSSSINIDSIPLVISNNSDKNVLPDPINEFRSLYGVFGDDYTNYAATGNATLEHTIFLNSSTNKPENHFFIYAERGFASFPYQGKWRHEFYPLDLMFKGQTYSKNCFSFVYISQDDADIILEDLNLEKSAYNYEKLIGQKTTILIDGNEYNYMIGNIYYNEGSFVKFLEKNIGKFFLTYKTFPKEIRKEATYFLGKYSFQNIQFLKHIRDTFEYSDFDSYIYFNNSSSNYSLKQIYFKSSNHLAITCLVFSVLYFITFLILQNFIFDRLKMKMICFISLFLLLFISFIFFKLFSAIPISIFLMPGLLLFCFSDFLYLVINFLSRVVKK